MEFSRWGLNQITRIPDRYREFKNFLADVLEGERSLLEDGATAPTDELAFEVASDFAKAFLEARVAKVRGSEERLAAAFEALAPYFEAGFCLRLDENDAVLEKMFLFGRLFSPPKSEAPRVGLPLPSFASRDHVYRSRVHPVLKAFRLERLTHLRDASAFAFSPKEGYAVILVCNRPHPWQVGALESAHDVIQMALSEKKAR